MSNTCIRCGKERIIVKQWEESITNEIRTNTISHTLTSCPDPECQKLVDVSLAVQKQKADERRAEKEVKDKSDREARQVQLEKRLSAQRKKK